VLRSIALFTPLVARFPAAGREDDEDDAVAPKADTRGIREAPATFGEVDNGGGGIGDNRRFAGIVCPAGTLSAV